MALKVAQEVLEVLDRAEADGPNLRLVGQLDRKLYVAANDVLAAAGGKWNRKAKAHVFDGDAADAIEPIILTGEYTRTKQDFGQFDSPPEVVERVIHLARIEPNMTVLEPSAGIGNIAFAAEKAGGIVSVVEVDPKRAANLGAHALVKDFLGMETNAFFDRVVMNPPFAKQVDIDHVLHAAKFLKPGGRLVSVMSAGVRFRESAKTIAFREFVAAHRGQFEDLPAAAFKASGTAVHTCIVSFNA